MERIADFGVMLAAMFTPTSSVGNVRVGRRPLTSDPKMDEEERRSERRIRPTERRAFRRIIRLLDPLSAAELRTLVAVLESEPDRELAEVVTFVATRRLELGS